MVNLPKLRQSPEPDTGLPRGWPPIPAAAQPYYDAITDDDPLDRDLLLHTTYQPYSDGQQTWTADPTQDLDLARHLRKLNMAGVARQHAERQAAQSTYMASQCRCQVCGDTSDMLAMNPRSWPGIPTPLKVCQVCALAVEAEGLRRIEAEPVEDGRSRIEALRAVLAKEGKP